MVLLMSSCILCLLIICVVFLSGRVVISEIVVLGECYGFGIVYIYWFFIDIYFDLW